MAVNRGKDFEQQIRSAFNKIPDTSVYRLQDSMGGYSGVANICDFIIYHYPIQYFIECKSHHGKSFPFSCVTDNQWMGLLKMSKIKGVVAGIIVWFIDLDLTYFVDISYLDAMKNSGRKSIKPNDLCDSYWAIEIKGKKKRVLFDYDISDFFRGTL